MPRTKGSKNKPKTDSPQTKSETSSVESPAKAKPNRATVSAADVEEPTGLNPKQKSKILARNWTIATIQKQIAELTIRLDEELDGLAQDVAGEAEPSKPKSKTVRRTRMQQQELPTVFAPEQSEEAGAELDV